MSLLMTNVMVFMRALVEGGEGELSAPVYQLASLYWWGALLLISLIIFIAWMLISWQARHFDQQLSLASSHAAHHLVEEPLRAAEVSSSPAPPEAVLAESPALDDLTLIEGIGPVIARLLLAKGITSFTKLAEADPQDLTRFMKEANLRLANTTSWSEQARLAAAGDFEGLRTYQSRLKGGREV
jgi:predicted flap endonuclease-1-like 5' DNA nuclease